MHPFSLLSISFHSFLILFLTFSHPSIIPHPSSYHPFLILFSSLSHPLPILFSSLFRPFSSLTHSIPSFSHTSLSYLSYPFCVPFHSFPSISTALSPIQNVKQLSYFFYWMSYPFSVWLGESEPYGIFVSLRFTVVDLQR